MGGREGRHRARRRQQRTRESLLFGHSLASSQAFTPGHALSFGPRLLPRASSSINSITNSCLPSLIVSDCILMSQRESPLFPLISPRRAALRWQCAPAMATWTSSAQVSSSRAPPYNRDHATLNLTFVQSKRSLMAAIKHQSKWPISMR